MLSLKRIMLKIINCLIVILSVFLAPIISYIAKSGVGTEQCLKCNCLPVNVHYYQPIPVLSDLDERDIWNKKSNLSGINFEPSRYISFLKSIGENYGKECRWPLEKTDDQFTFYTDNGSFSYGCASALHCMIRCYKPMRFIEIGSGMSSLVILEALSKNSKSTTDVKPEYIIIDPYPNDTIKQLSPQVTIIHEKVEKIDVSIFQKLGKNDILFIDSSHVIKIGGDVNYLILDVLPVLKPGVIIHFHDIPLPYEYPEIYAKNANFRVFWTEAYFLQAFLCFNKEFEILLPMAYLMKEHMDIFKDTFKDYPKKKFSNSGSFWIKKVDSLA